jgi:hypothetical protein
MTPSARNYCFTLNNYTEEEKEDLVNAADPEVVRYLCFGEEVGEQGTRHLQGYISFIERRTFRWVKNYVSQRAHIESAKGSPNQNREYCRKQEDEEHGNFFEWGNLPGGKGQRSDLAGVVESIKSGKRLREIADEHPVCFLRYSRGINALRMLYSEPRDWETEVFVLYGKTGSGKTREAWEVLCEKDAFFYGSGGWFDGYDEHRNVIFDDFGGHEFKITYLLKLLDRYPMWVPIKGGFVQWKPKRIVITSNYAPDEWYPGAKDEHRAALIRRIHNKKFFPF